MYQEHSTNVPVGARFDLYVKAASDGESLGDCPFCHYVQMYAKSLGITDDQFRIHFVDTTSKPESFMKLNEKGTVPVLVDNQTKRTFTESADIAKHFQEQFPGSDPLAGYSGPDKAFFGVVLAKLGKLLKNKEEHHDSEKCKSELYGQLKTINDYLEQSKADRKGKYLAGEHVSELDCVFMPRLRHVVVAGGHYEGLSIEEFPALKEYLDNALSCNEFTSTCCVEGEIVKGWERHRK
ncbi:glutathione S-transferase DHAR1, mitochondrial-like [Mizuhopecten yessoensis]|uniref:Glutathione S-transferase DHAR3, chloroplastic n=1 Tax=Mizuhopecten yessoensis TaxID=6573 RepID=A0A210PK07_MIZYE|nr:glutathione S-transferase DHAR1, mitochondrial-like [Mizuhopecten yessoensis]OWF36830.1 Glutathione S-transferase DHAR3, chloroplastic [Mizuhopecten yessoensis]